MGNITINIARAEISVYPSAPLEPIAGAELVVSAISGAVDPTARAGFTKLDAAGNALPDNATEWAAVHDHAQGLIWSATDTSEPCAWAEADAACKNATICGQPGRLPTRAELQGIVDYSRVDPAIDIAYFRDPKSRYYWSSSAYAASPVFAWSVSFGNGHVDWGGRSDHGCVRAVRSAAPVAGQ